ncbi:hypothetical protein FIBSPDRAFT_466895 [Athelia psychrophila]|uniref:Uncharacterized protein n=1 Tax=Athelia psychrophila TaxID=1759441 RepID=A0A166LLC0_9AGAM|nr:hypothetical protein FIBSPDRAFT_466895 [Fibularhizoctonia sp. CBS 109695]
MSGCPVKSPAAGSPAGLRLAEAQTKRRRRLAKQGLALLVSTSSCLRRFSTTMAASIIFAHRPDFPAQTLSFGTWDPQGTSRLRPILVRMVRCLYMSSLTLLCYILAYSPPPHSPARAAT